MKELIESDNKAYHANKTHLSSSNLKMLLKDPQQFYFERILGQGKAQETKDVFDEGSFVHTLVLEADKISQYAIFPGLRKAGKEWESFREANKGKTILSIPQVNRCETLARAALAMPVAVEMLKTGFAEHTMVSQILGVDVKARADFIDINNHFILDVKTTAMPSGREVFAQTCSDFMYQLSAALYCQIAFNTYGHLFKFFYLVISKQDKQAHIYEASTEHLSFGSAQVTQALVLYKQCLESGVWSTKQPTKVFDSANYEIELV